MLDEKTNYHEEQDFSSNYHDGVSFSSPKGVNSAKKGYKESNQSSVARERSPAPVSPAPQVASVSSSTKKSVPKTAVHSSHSVDVGEDRPSHWNRTRPSTAARASNKNTTANKSTRSSKLVSNVVKVAQIPKPKPLPSQPAPLSFGENSRPPSFKPSWLTSTTTASQSGNNSHTQASSRTQRISTPVGEERLLIEAIQEEAEEEPGGGSYSSTFRPPPRSALQMEDAGSGGDYDVPFQDSFGSPQGHRMGRHVSPQRPVTVHTLSTPHTAVSSVRDSYYEHDSATKLSRSHSSHSSTAHGRVSGGAKAKPGSLKAKLQKVWRDTDANENRIINIPFDPHSNSGTSKSRALDLQDPRSRAVHYVDAQVDQILPDEAPFKVVLLSVLGTWHKHKAVEPSDGVSVVSDPTALTTSIATEAEAGKEVEVEAEVTMGSRVKAYFKADTCVGQGRGLVEDTVLRVYDPHLWSVHTSSIGCASGNRSGGGATAWDYVMISTNCWELVDLSA